MLQQERGLSLDLIHNPWITGTRKASYFEVVAGRAEWTNGGHVVRDRQPGELQYGKIAISFTDDDTRGDVVGRVQTAIDNHWTALVEWSRTSRDTEYELVELVLPMKEFSDALMFGRIGEYGQASYLAGIGVAKAGAELYGAHLLGSAGRKLFVRVIGADAREVSVTRLVTGPSGRGVVQHSTEPVVRGAAEAGIRRFRSFSHLRRELGPAGEGRVWHHIVEKRKPLLGKFGAGSIHSTENVVAATREVNQQIANYYSHVRPFTGGKTVRKWLETQSFEDQMQFGQRVLDLVEGGGSLP